MIAHRLVRSAAGLLVVAALLAGCSDEVSGSAAQGGDTPATDWTQRSVLSVLGTFPADSSTRHRISFVDVPALNAVAQRGTYPQTTTEPGVRPAAESAWVEELAVSDACATTLDAPSDPLRTGLPAASLTIQLTGTDRTGIAAFCAGGTLLAPRIADPDIRGDDLQEQTVGGIAGTTARGTWIGTAGDRIVVADTAVLGDVLTGAIRGTARESGSLLQDRGVRAVMDAAPDAAMVEMGTDLTALNRVAAPRAVLAAYQAAIDGGDFAVPPVPTFGGYSWTPTGGAVGTSTFVTTYPSPANAKTMVALLTDTWKRLGPSKYEQAVTVQQGDTVITRVPQVPPTAFRGTDDGPAEYPAFLGRET